MDVITVVQRTAILGDPHVNTDGRDRLSLRWSVFEALVARDRSGAFVPILAERWMCADDARTWTFWLRDGVTFHGGQHLSSEQVVASIRRMCDPSAGGEMATQGVYASYLHDADITATGRDVVRIVTPEPMADLLDLLVDIAIVPDAGERAGGSEAPPNGTGPYRADGSDPGAVSLKRYATYWGDPAAFDRVLWRAERDTEQRVTMLLDGRADLIADIGPSNRDRIEAAPGSTVVDTSVSLCVAFLLNASTGVCSDRRVRQALNHAVDVDALVRDVMSGAAERVNGPLAPIHLGYDHSVSPYPYDPARARRLLADAGHGDGLQLVFDIPLSLPDEALELGTRIAMQVKDVGIDVTLETYADRPAYAQMVRDKRIHDGCCFDSSPLSTWRVLREKIHSGVAGPWWQGYDNPEVNRLLDLAATTVDTSEREAIYRRAYRMLHDDAPWLFLYTPRVSFGVGPRLSGWLPGFNGLVQV